MHSGPLAQARQLPPVMQMGVLVGQSGWPRHWMQAPVEPQNFVLGEAAAHSLLPAQARQRPVAVLQNGVVPLHWLFCVHCTHEPASAPAVAHSGRP
jgi:hypothetical protein